MSTNIKLESTPSWSSEERNSTLEAFRYIFGISFGILLLIIIITFGCYIHSRRRINDDDSDSVPGTPELGLDDKTLQAYPKFLYSQTKKNHDQGGGGGGGGQSSVTASGCSICLQEYKDADVLRLLPECGHFFHLKCVDPWFKLHTTCPICRRSPAPSTPSPGNAPALIHSIEISATDVSLVESTHQLSHEHNESIQMSDPKWTSSIESSSQLCITSYVSIASIP